VRDGHLVAVGCNAFDQELGQVRLVLHDQYSQRPESHIRIRSGPPRCHQPHLQPSVLTRSCTHQAYRMRETGMGTTQSLQCIKPLAARTTPVKTA
jgi:hypothetical protein